MYDALTKKPNTVEETVDLIQWHESCKSVQKRKVGLRQVYFSEAEEDESTAVVRRVNGGKFVTEERLNQFGRELVETLSKEVKGAIQPRAAGRYYGPRRRGAGPSSEC